MLTCNQQQGECVKWAKTTKIMDVEIIGVMIPIIFLIGAFIVVVYLRKYQNIERMAIIDKGLDPALFKVERSAAGTLRAALLFIGAGIGLLLGYMLDETFGMHEVAYFSMLFIFGGLGLGLAYMIEEKKSENKG
ncbi:MAG TPA: DUF6249 domain-containing protein [Cyclobacteriaceae bacterium]